MFSAMSSQKEIALKNQCKGKHIHDNIMWSVWYVQCIKHETVNVKHDCSVSAAFSFVTVDWNEIYDCFIAHRFQMENIEVFLKACENYGVPSNSLFPTADLFEGRNMAMVISTILQLGSEVRNRSQLFALTMYP